LLQQISPVRRQKVINIQYHKPSLMTIGSRCPRDPMTRKPGCKSVLISYAERQAGRMTDRRQGYSS